MSNCNANNICPSFNFMTDDIVITENFDSSFNIYGLNSSSVIARKAFTSQLKCADLNRMTKVQKYAYEAKGYLFNLN